jgi:protease I
MKRAVVSMTLAALCAAAVVLAGCGGDRGETRTGPETAGDEATAGAEKKLAGRKVLMVIASQKFRDEELFVPRKALADAGADVTLAASSLEEATGMLGGKARADLLLADAKAADYDAVVFVGGSGAKEYLDSAAAHGLARSALEEGKVLGAICLAPGILANAGLLDGRKATCYGGGAANLKARGAQYTGGSVEVDGRIVTADGPRSAQAFAEALIKALGAD